MNLPISNRLSYWLLLLSITLLPWYVVRFSMAGIPLTLLEVGILLAIGVWVIEELWRRRSGNGEATFSFRTLLANRERLILASLIGLFGLAATWSLLLSPNTQSALGVYKAYFVEPLLLFGVALTVVRSRAQWWGLVGALMIVVLEVSVFTLTQSVWGWPVYAPAEMAQGRPSATFNTANAIGLLIGPLVSFGLVLGAGSLHQRRGWLGALLLLVSGIGVMAVVLSESMGAIGGMIVAIVAALLLWAGRSLTHRWLSGSAIASVIVMTLYVVGMIGYFLWFNNPPEVANPYTRPGFTTFTVRQCVWEGTVKGLASSPLAGFGLANFTDRYLESATCDAEPLVYPHTFVLNFWVETGLLGLLSMSGIVGWWLWKSIQLIQREGYALWVGLACLTVPVYWLVHGLVDVPYFKNDLSVIWWIGLALLLSGGQVWRSLVKG